MNCFAIHRLVLLAAAIAGSTLSPGGAAAQDRPVRVATVNMPRVFNEVQETKDIQVRLRQEQGGLAAEQKQKLDELQKMRAEGENYRKGSPQYNEWRQRFRRAEIAQQAWAATAKQDLDWRLKHQSRDIFDKIAAAVTEYATSNQIDLVIADHQPTLTDEELDKVPAEQIGAVLDRRRVIYASKNADISDAIIASLDAKYKAGGGGQGPVGQGPIGQTPAGANAAAPAGANLRGNDAGNTGPGNPAPGNPQRRPNNR